MATAFRGIQVFKLLPFLKNHGLLSPVWQPQITSVRFRNKINIKKPRPPHFTRAKVEELSKPKFPRQINSSTPLYELCKGPGYIKKEIVNPYEVLLAKEAFNWFQKHKYIFFFHENSMTYDENLEMKLLLKNCGVAVRKYGKNTLKYSFIGTVYESTLGLFHSHTLLGFGNDVNLSSLFSELRKTKVVLLAGIIDNRLLSISELKYYSSLPDIETVRGILVSVLNSATSNIVQHLSHHPQTLVRHLEQYRKHANRDE